MKINNIILLGHSVHLEKVAYANANNAAPSSFRLSEFAHQLQWANKVDREKKQQAEYSTVYIRMGERTEDLVPVTKIMFVQRGKRKNSLLTLVAERGREDQVRNWSSLWLVPWPPYYSFLPFFFGSWVGGSWLTHTLSPLPFSEKLFSHSCSVKNNQSYVTIPTRPPLYAYYK